MKPLPFDIGTIHFVGIGGIGMSGIAEVLHSLGYRVQGSDQSDGYNLQRLKKKGIRTMVGHAAENILDAQGKKVAVVVRSSAVKDDNPEIIAAYAQKILVILRADMLAELMRLKWSIGVAGTHGKTTTTSLVGHVLEGAGFDPTVINGGIVNAYGTNTRMGESKWMVVETDESDGTFTRLPVTVGIVTNIDPEHMEHYGTFDRVKEAFCHFVNNLPFYGYAAVCIDHPVVAELIPSFVRRVIPYGFSEKAEVRAVNIRGEPGGSLFDITFGGETIKDVRLPMFGRHNVLNSLAAFAVARDMGIAPEKIKESLSSFAGVKRRFTIAGAWNGVTIIDDYGHHPVEIEAVLKAGKEATTSRGGGRLIAVVQPHRYTRLSSLFDQFCACLDLADTVIVADVYSAGEEPISGANRDALAMGIKKHGHKNVLILERPEALPELIGNLAKPGDFVICLGAGSITQWANALPADLERLFPQRKEAVS